MKLSMWSSFLVELPPEEAMCEFVKHGYNGCDLSEEHSIVLLERGEAKTEGRKFKKFCDSIGMEVSQAHMSMRHKLCDDGATDVLCRWLDLYEACGVKQAVLHLDYLNDSGLTTEEKREKNLEALKALTNHLEGSDVKIALENINGIFTTADVLLWFIEKLGDEHLSICLDTGHLHHSDHPDQAAFIRRAGRHLRALHVHDNAGKTDQHYFPFAPTGTRIIQKVTSINWQSVMTALREIGYSDLFNYEIPGERIVPREILDAKLDYGKKIYDYLLTL